MSQIKLFANGNKKFLNDHFHEHGTVSYFVKSTYYGKTYNLNANLRITDCNEQINLDFGIYLYSDKFDKEKFDNKFAQRIEKLDNLIKELQDMRTDICQAHKNISSHYLENDNEDTTD